VSGIPQAHGLKPKASAAGQFIECGLSVMIPRSRTREIEFNNTGVYQYYDVPKTALEEMLAQNSLGSYFNTKFVTSIRARRFDDCRLVATAWAAAPI
jgi:hypothetical protein